MAGKWDTEIAELFHEGLGAHKIARKLGLKHVATVSKRLIALDLRRPIGTNNTPVSNGVLDVEFTRDKNGLKKAAERYLEFVCAMSNYSVLRPNNDESFDLMVRFDVEYEKIQVKSSSCRGGNSSNFVFSLTRTRNNSTGSRKVYYAKEDTDYFFLMDISLNCWLIPFKELEGKGSVTPADRYPGYKIEL